MPGVRLPVFVLIAALPLGACGPATGVNVPIEETRAAPWHYEVYEMSPAPAEQPGRVIHADGRTWFAYDAPHRFFGPGFGTEMPAAALRSVGTHDGVPLYALHWDAPPHGRLFAPLGADRWREYRPVAF